MSDQISMFEGIDGAQPGDTTEDRARIGRPLTWEEACAHIGRMVCCLFDTENESKWIIDVDNEHQLLRCESCGGRVIRKWYDLAVGDKGFSFCPYCGKTITNAVSMIVKWPGYREKASPKWIAINKGERGYSAGDFRCSECGKPNPCWSLTEYCPNCGEHMKEGT